MALIKTNRDLRIDFFRGLALWWIFTDHIPADWLGNLSIRNFALCDATEIFVLLAGYAGGLAYGGTMRSQGWLYAGADVIRRAWTLYIAHIFLFVIFAAQVGLSAAALDRADYLDEIHLDVLGEAPYRALFEALTLHFQPAYLNILPLYVAILVMFAFALPLLRWPWILAGLSLGLYMAARLFSLNLPSWTGGGWFFNPLTWQLLFMMGAILAFAPGEAPRRHVRWIDAIAGLVMLFGLVMQWGVWVHPEWISWMPEKAVRVLMSVDKGGLHPFRLVSILALTWLCTRLVPPHARWVQSRIAAPFVMAGQHSLPVFCAGIFLAFLGRLATEVNDGFWVQTGVNTGGAVALWSVGAIAAWYANKGKARRPAPAPAPAQAASAQAEAPVVIRAALVAGFVMLACGAQAATPAPPCPPPLEADAEAPPLPHLSAAMKPGGAVDILAVGAGPDASTSKDAPLIKPATSPAAAPGFFFQLSHALANGVRGLRASVTVHGGRGLSAPAQLDIIRAALAQHHYHLVLWQTGTLDAVQDDPPEEFYQALADGADAAALAGADLVLVEPQYSRFLEANANLSPYLAAMQAAGAAPDTLVFQRYTLMHDWEDAGLIDLEHAALTDRPAVAARLHACLAAELARALLAGAAAAR